MQIILTYGCNDAVTSYNETSATITINDESVVFNFTDGQLVPVTSAWQQGSTPMFFYRTVNDGTNDVTVVCTPDGKLYVNNNDDYILRVNDGFAWSTGAASQTLITNCGGKIAMDEAAGDDNLMTVISMDDYTVVFTEDGEVTVGAITAIGEAFWRQAPDFETNHMIILVDMNGKVIQAINEDGSGGLCFCRAESAPNNQCLVRSYNDGIFTQAINDWGMEYYRGDQSGQIVTFDVERTEYAVTRNASQQSYSPITPTPKDYA